MMKVQTCGDSGDTSGENTKRNVQLIVKNTNRSASGDSGDSGIAKVVTNFSSLLPKGVPSW